MEFQEVVRRRRMVRSYSDEPVDPAVVDRALANATRAPSAGFSQGWAFLVLDRPDDVRRFWAATTDAGAEPDRWLAGMSRAPVVVIPCSSKAAYLDRYAEDDKGWADRDESRWPVPYWDIDTGMASLLILQTVADEGLGACFFGIPPHRLADVRQTFGIPDRFDPIGAITVGHPSATAGAKGSPSTRPRRPLDEVVHRGRWA
jgi:nitroreductase